MTDTIEYRSPGGGGGESSAEMNEERLLKAREVAEWFGVEVGTVLDHFEAGDLPGFRLWGKKGGPVRFRLSELEATLDRWRVGLGTGEDVHAPPTHEEGGDG